MNLIFKIIVILTVEIALAFLFKFISPSRKIKTYFDFRSIIKGIIERAFLTFGFLSNLYHVLTLFGALKLGTRLKHGDKEETEDGLKKELLYNDYYLIGNFISVSASILYFLMLK